jgi:uracil phosphoribosyltransferase
MSQPLPPNVHLSTHPCLQSKLSQLRQSTANARETKALVHEITLIVGCEATAAGLSTKKGTTVSRTTHFPNKTYSTLLTTTSQSKTHLGYEYTTTTIIPETISLVPILRSGLGMLDGSSLSLRFTRKNSNRSPLDQPYKPSSPPRFQSTTSASSASPQLSSL